MSVSTLSPDSRTSEVVTTPTQDYSYEALNKAIELFNQSEPAGTLRDTKAFLGAWAKHQASLLSVCLEYAPENPGSSLGFNSLETLLDAAVTLCSGPHENALILLAELDPFVRHPIVQGALRNHIFGQFPVENLLRPNGYPENPEFLKLKVAYYLLDSENPDSHTLKFIEEPYFTPNLRFSDIILERARQLAGLFGEGNVDDYFTGAPILYEQAGRKFSIARYIFENDETKELIDVAIGISHLKLTALSHISINFGDNGQQVSAERHQQLSLLGVSVAKKEDDVKPLIRRKSISSTVLSFDMIKETLTEAHECLFLENTNLQDGRTAIDFSQLIHIGPPTERSIKDARALLESPNIRSCWLNDLYS